MSSALGCAFGATAAVAGLAASAAAAGAASLSLGSFDSVWANDEIANAVPKAIVSNREFFMTSILFRVPAGVKPSRFGNAGLAKNYQPRTFAKINGATIVASDSITNRGVLARSLPQVIFSFGTAPEYEPKLVVESLIWQKYPHSGTGWLTMS